MNFWTREPQAFTRFHAVLGEWNHSERNNHDPPALHSFFRKVSTKPDHAHEAQQPFKTTKVGHVEQFFRSHAVALHVDSTKNTTEPVRLF
jgi:hypothetical protein